MLLTSGSESYRAADAEALHAELVHHLIRDIIIKLQPPGIEPGSPAWQASIIPLDHGCCSRTFEENQFN